jgi:glycerol-3-phosphate dehydrogenase
LLHIAPHISRPLRFVLPHVAELRPAWMLRLGLLLYDHLSARVTLPASQRIDLRESEYGAPLNAKLRKAFVYFDGWIDDARLVILNLKSATQRSAHIFPRTRLLSADATPSGWRALLEKEGNGTIELHARVVINAAGPWVDSIRLALLPDAAPRTRLVQGSHIVLPALYAGDHAYVLQAADRRVVFLLPFGPAHTLVGTTDVATRSPLAPIEADAAEVQYLCAATAPFLRDPIAADRVVHTFSGVRALHDDGHANPSAVSRDYSLLLEQEPHAPMVSIIGGKLTTYRVLAEKALDALRAYFPAMPAASWTGSEPLPGGCLPEGGLLALQSQLTARYPKLPRVLLAALSARHGTLAAEILGDVQQETELGLRFSEELYAREVDYFVAHEWATRADDVLWRRTKAGLNIDAQGIRALDAYIRQRVG